MRALAFCLGIGILLTAACGGGSSSPGGAGGTGGTPSGAGGSGSIPLVGACANLTCLNDMVSVLAACPTTGACTQQASAATGAVSLCYANGVKVQEVIDLSTFAMTMSAKNGGSTCYSMTVSGMMANPMVVTVNNGSGKLIATISVDTSADTETVTCPGGAATVIDQTCGSASEQASSAAAAGESSTCTDGTCTY